MQLWKDKENYTDIVESEIENLDKFIDENEKEALKHLAFSRSDSTVSDPSPKEAFQE